jgi:Conjugal transfer protein/Phage integrase, N-terminal SAM-like domain
MKNENGFPALLERFFTQRLIAQRRVSSHTIASYRDTFRLLLQFVEKRLHKPPSGLALTDLDTSLIGAFLDELEKDRGNGARTRNLRLTAIHGGNEHIRPLRVFDDGEKTYLQMPAEMRNREAPVLLIVGNDGKGEVTNYRVQHQTYIVDRLFDRANLVLGAGKKSKGLTVEISRSPKG